MIVSETLRFDIMCWCVACYAVGCANSEILRAENFVLSKNQTKCA
jgi:hypothetical protein